MLDDTSPTYSHLDHARLQKICSPKGAGMHGPCALAQVHGYGATRPYDNYEDELTEFRVRKAREHLFSLWCVTCRPWYAFSVRMTKVPGKHLQASVIHAFCTPHWSGDRFQSKWPSPGHCSCIPMIGWLSPKEVSSTLPYLTVTDLHRRSTFQYQLSGVLLSLSNFKPVEPFGLSL